MLEWNVRWTTALGCATERDRHTAARQGWFGVPITFWYRERLERDRRERVQGKGQ